MGWWYPHARGQLPGAGSPLSTLWVPGNELRLGESAFIRWDILLALDSLWLLSKCFVVYDCSQRWVNLVFQKAQCAVQLLWANLWNGSRKPFLVHNKWHPNIFPVWAFRHQRRLDLFLKSCGYFFLSFCRVWKQECSKWVDAWDKGRNLIAPRFCLQLTLSCNNTHTHACTHAHIHAPMCMMND